MHNIYVTPKLIKKVITNLDLVKKGHNQPSKGSGPDSNPMVFVKNHGSELLYAFAELFNMYLKESCF